MPIYPYRCQSCEHEFEVLQKIADEPLSECPQCGELRLRKLLTAAAFRLKGSGWYETDFKNADKKPEKDKSEVKKDSDAKKESDKKTAAGSKDSKSTAKADTKKTSTTKDEG